MTTTAASDTAMIADYLNPVLSATRSVFETMLNCTPKRVGLRIKERNHSESAVSGVIGISGSRAGAIAVCLPREVAMVVYERMVGVKVDEVTRDVCDAVGELTNMIAGAAKAQLAHMNLSLGLPNVVSGSFDLSYPSDVSPFCVMFESELGPFMIEAGFSKLS